MSRSSSFARYLPLSHQFLQVRVMRADGDCAFNAIAEGINESRELLSLTVRKVWCPSSLRSLVANSMNDSVFENFLLFYHAGLADYHFMKDISDLKELKRRTAIVSTESWIELQRRLEEEEQIQEQQEERGEEKVELLISDDKKNRKRKSVPLLRRSMKSRSERNSGGIGTTAAATVSSILWADHFQLQTLSNQLNLHLLILDQDRKSITQPFIHIQPDQPLSSHSSSSSSSSSLSSNPSNPSLPSVPSHFPPPPPLYIFLTRTRRQHYNLGFIQGKCSWNKDTLPVELREKWRC